MRAAVRIIFLDENGEKFFGEGPCRLLHAVDETGSLRAAAQSMGMAYTKALKIMITEMKKNGYQGGKVRIVHCQNETAAQEFRNLVKAEFPDCNITTARMTALCSFYAEDGGLMVGYETTI